MKDLENRSVSTHTLTLSSWVRENYKLLLSVFLIGLFSYGFAVFNYNFGIDEDTAFWEGPRIFLTGHATINRWAMFVYYYVLLPGVFYPFIGNILAIFFISLSYCLFISNHSSLSFFQRLLFCGIAISLPTFGTMFEFSFMVAQVSCSITLIVFAYLFTINGNTLLEKWIVPLMLCTFATFTYQSLLYIIIGLFIIDCLLGKFNITEKSSYRIFCRIIFICILSITCYVGGSILLHLITGIPQSAYGLSTALFLHKSIVNSFISVYRFMIDKFHSTLLLSFLFLPIPIGVIIFFGRPHSRYLLSLSLVIGYFFFPFFGLGLVLPIRSWFFAPFIFAAVFLLAYLKAQHKVKILFLIFSIWIICFNSSINARSALLDSFSGKRDQLIASRIYNELYDVDEKYLKDAKLSLIIGTIKLNRILPALSDGEREIYGASFFSWCGEHWRIYRYLGILGVQLPPSLNLTSKEAKIKSLAIVKDMPAYPARGFIKVVDDVLIIKLSNQNK